MNNWNKLLAVLDATLGFPNKQSSTVKKTGQAYDQNSGEHVITLEYRIKVNPGTEQQKTQSMPLLAQINTQAR